MSDLTNTFTAEGTIWAGSPPVANVLTAQGAQWTALNEGGVSANGFLGLGGSASALIMARPQNGLAAGMIGLAGNAQAETALSGVSKRRQASPSASANGGRLVRPNLSGPSRFRGTSHG